jgi:uncharacterized damage-inducible protein DinB
MGVTKELLRADLKYSVWATRTLLDACRQLTEDEQFRDLGISHRNVLETLEHYFVSEKFWMECLTAHAMPPMRTIGKGPERPKPRLEIWEKDWVGVWKALDTWLAALPEEELGAALLCELEDEKEMGFTRWELLRHSVNHSSLHRGQVVGLLRMLGKQPPNVDMMTFYQVR